MKERVLVLFFKMKSVCDRLLNVWAYCRQFGLEKSNGVVQAISHGKGTGLKAQSPKSKDQTPKYSADMALGGGGGRGGERCLEQFEYI